MNPFILIYGAYGYTGRLIIAETLKHGLEPVLGGRNPDKLKALAEPLGLKCRAFALNRPQDVDSGLEGMQAVIHCAGPFSHTADAMAEGCLRRKVHYTDITGEIAVYEAMAARDRAAREAGVMLMPGVGFDVVPSDCLALWLKQQLPTATTLTLGFYSRGGPSHGTAKTVVESLIQSGMVRQNGKLVPVPGAWKQRGLDFGEEKRIGITIPWGDIASAYYSTGIPNIEVYMAAPASLRLFVHSTRYLGWLLGARSVQRFASARIPEGGPDEDKRARNYCLLWGEVTDSAGGRAEARMRTPDGYSLTAATAVCIARKILAGNAPAGYQTPAKAYGSDLILEVEGTRRW
ncbi:MAG: saccharopine dehydrogenase NADP-binding domain-containing protein [Candidatus Hydrogenedentes bacterium]|nr:saccharopine dehydrogenase NADP-binding domain-containing protein [Candidatus Hydrogenedentota bacterium]